MGSPLDNFDTQANGSEKIGGTFVAVLCRLIPECLGETGLGERVRNWTGNASADALALRVCGGLHALVLTGAAPDLAAAYPPNPTDPDKLRAALIAEIAEHDAFLTNYLDSPPQTNETGRSSMILGAALHIAKQTGLPLSVLEIGASAGLNLWFSRYAYDFGDGRRWGRDDAPLTVASDWSGTVPDLDAPLYVAARRGCDRNPLIVRDPDDRLRLLSYVWPEQPQRLDRLRKALDYVGQRPSVLDRDDAATWLEHQLQAEPDTGLVRMVYHTVVWQYLPEETRNQLTETIEAAGAAATGEAPLAWFSFESDDYSNARDGGVMKLTLWPGGETRELGRADFHGRWVRWA